MLFQRCAKGESGAWESFLRAYRPFIEFAARRGLERAGGPAHPQDVEEIVGQALTLLLDRGCEKMLRYDPRFSPTTWLGLVTLTAVHDRLRREGRLRIPEESERAIARMWMPADGPVDRATETETRERLRCALQSLPARDQAAIRLHYEDGVPHRRIGTILGLTDSGVSRMMERVHARLREAMTPPGGKIRSGSESNP